MPEPNEPSAALLLKAILRVLDEGSIAALATLTNARKNVGTKILVAESGDAVGSFGDVALDRVVAKRTPGFLESRDEAHLFHVRDFAPELTEWAEASILFERLEPEPRLVICGAGHVGAALARLASLTGYKATLIDDRPDFVVRDRFPDGRIELIAAQNWSDAVREAIGSGRGVSVAVVTRGHNEDEECLRAVIATDADYVGLIGSKRRTNMVLDRLREAGADVEKLRKVHAPIGLDIGAVTPEEVALAILSEMVADRRGGTGGSLSSWRRESELGKGKQVR
ncbi:MAG: XdhC family protein [Pyrinomonadaceae bacterium]|jgi:xanthine dehydrogenase accessory factor|nr:XdhC family protein [Pyrinomonadaceae bacterium]